MPAYPGWWASDAPLLLAAGYPFRSTSKWPQPITVSTEHRLRHLYVVGSSGSGKSRLARSLLQQDVDANRGWSLLDPLDLSREVLGYIAERAMPGRLTPEKLAALGDKVVILDPTNQQYGCPGINVLEVGPGQVGYEVVDAVIAAIKEIWSDSYGPRLEDICRNGLLLLLEHRLTLCEMVPLLSDQQFRTNLVQRCNNPEVRLFWQDFLTGLRPGELKTWFESTRNKMSAFLSSPYIRPILGQARTTINFRELLDQGKWLIVSLSQDRMKESGRLLGSVIAILLHQALLSREHTRPEQRIFHTLFIDEAQNYFSPTLLHILEGARKYGLGCCLLHQNLTQPPFDKNPAFVDTILSNTHSRIFFALSYKDATRLAGEIFRPSGKEVKHQECSWCFGIPLERPTLWSINEELANVAGELQAQRQAEAFVSFKGTGETEPWVATVPHVPDVHPDPAKVDALRRHVAAKYYRPVAQVEAEIRERWVRLRQAPPPPPATPRDFRR